MAGMAHGIICPLWVSRDETAPRRGIAARLANLTTAGAARSLPITFGVPSATGQASQRRAFSPTIVHEYSRPLRDARSIVKRVDRLFSHSMFPVSGRAGKHAKLFVAVVSEHYYSVSLGEIDAFMQCAWDQLFLGWRKMIPMKQRSLVSTFTIISPNGNR